MKLFFRETGVVYTGDREVDKAAEEEEDRRRLAEGCDKVIRLHWADDERRGAGPRQTE